MRQGRRGRAAALAAALALVATLAATGSGAAGAAPTVEPAGWEEVPAPPLDGQASLNDVVALGPRDAWAVGTIFEGDTTRTLTLHWDGTAWTRVPSPNRGDQTWLFGVSGSSPSDVWAVGYDRTADNRHRTLTMRWDGSVWQIVPSPDPGSEGSLLNDVAAVSPSEVWAVGSSTVAFPLLGETLTLRWDGERWERVPSPNPSQTGVGSNLHSVAVAPSGDLWAAGAMDQGDLVMGTMVIRWHRGEWSLVPAPSDPAGSLAGAVAAAGPRDVWAVGWRQGELVEPLALRWRAGRWTPSPVPTDPAVESSLADVTVARGRTWVVGYEGANTFTARHDGRSWTVVDAEDPGTVANTFVAVAAIPRTGCLWAVGQQSDGDQGRALIERHCPGAP